ncbi:MAG: hypothetical protein ABFD92_11540 [Planctomycetaceae bacterium]|nr:hypothetical protein [Planctomycetaceae bacterium]
MGKKSSAPKKTQRQPQPKTGAPAADVFLIDFPLDEVPKGLEPQWIINVSEWLAHTYAGAVERLTYAGSALNRLREEYRREEYAKETRAQDPDEAARNRIWRTPEMDAVRAASKEVEKCRIMNLDLSKAVRRWLPTVYPDLQQVGVSEITDRPAAVREWRRISAAATGLQLETGLLDFEGEARQAEAVPGTGISVTTAAKISGINKGTIWRAAKAAKIDSNGKKGRSLRLDDASFNRWQLDYVKRGEKQETDEAVQQKFDKIKGE